MVRSIFTQETLPLCWDGDLIDRLLSVCNSILMADFSSPITLFLTMLQAALEPLMELITGEVSFLNEIIVLAHILLTLFLNVAMKIAFFTFFPQLIWALTPWSSLTSFNTSPYALLWRFALLWLILTYLLSLSDTYYAFVDHIWFSFTIKKFFQVLESLVITTLSVTLVIIMTTLGVDGVNPFKWDGNYLDTLLFLIYVFVGCDFTSPLSTILHHLGQSEVGLNLSAEERQLALLIVSWVMPTWSSIQEIIALTFLSINVVIKFSGLTLFAYIVCWLLSKGQYGRPLKQEFSPLWQYTLLLLLVLYGLTLIPW